MRARRVSWRQGGHQNVDPAHPDIFNTNRGCHIDQLFGPLNAQVVVDRGTALDITTNA